MYNIDFLSQMEKFRRDIFGATNSNEILPKFQFHRTYPNLNNVEVIPCKKTESGELVPETYIIR